MIFGEENNERGCTGGLGIYKKGWSRMRIEDKERFVMGVIVLFAGIACLIAAIYLHRGARIALTAVPIICGCCNIIGSIKNGD